jgi:protein-S-isoprenylcysteine O-methyltransferase Ste14
MNLQSLTPPRIAYLLTIPFGVAGLFVARLLLLPYSLVGLLPLGAGLWIMLAAHSLFVTRNTGVCPTTPTTQLIEDGPYRFTRNPMYLGMVLILAGIAILVGSPFAVIIDRYWIPFEEKKLDERFGARYQEYASRVRRWL